MRTTYNNGDAITLQENGCDGCDPSTINGVLCHESGCPESHKDYPEECKWCGQDYFKEYRFQTCCSEDCHNSYWHQLILILQAFALRGDGL